MAGRKPESSYAQALRVLELVELTRSGAWTLDSLAVALGVTRRTVARDVAALRAAHVRLGRRPCDVRLRSPWARCAVCTARCRGVDPAGRPCCGKCRAAGAGSSPEATP